VSAARKSDGIFRCPITQELAPGRGRPRVLVFMRGIEVPHHQDRKPSSKHADRCDPTVGQESERYTANVLRVPLANIICMAVASNWVKPRTGTT
jgi:hypothetical protein